ncbi:unnamed protein product [Oreochromis niloticus]|nr:unnamed protein product [Mustela putorius furo]
MAAGFLITRLLLVCLLSEVNYSSAFPRARSFVQPRLWQSEGEEEEVYNYENCHPFYYISAQGKTSEKQGGFMAAPIHICKQNHPIVYQKASNLKPANPFQPRSNVATKWPQETILPQPPSQKMYLSPKPKSYEFSLKIPFLDFLIRNDGKNSPNKKHEGGNDAPAVSKPGFQVSSSVSSSSVSQSVNTPTTSHVVHLASEHNPESPDSVKPEKPISAMIGSRQPFLNSAGTGNTETQEQPYPIKPQSSSTLFGSGRPFVSFATPQQEPHEPVHVQPSSSLAGSARPFLNFGTTHQQTYKPVHVKPPSSTLTELERPFLNFGTTRQHSYEPYPVKPQSNSAITGLRQPFLSSAGTEAQEKPYEPYPIKLHSSSTLAEPARPLRFALPQQNIHEPVRVKPTSSNQIGTERPFVSFGTTQQTRKQYPIKPQSSSNLVASARPFLSFAAPQQETYDLFHIKPQSSTPAGSERPYFGTTQQQTYEPYPIKPQFSSAMAASAKPFLTFAAPQQQAYEPFHIKPQSSSVRLTSDWPALNSAAARQNYEPVHAKIQSFDTWPYFRDRPTVSSSQMRVQRQDSARNKLDRKSDYLKLFDVAGSDGHNELAYI